MSIRDVILDCISKTSIFEMARSRQDAKRIITDLSPQIVLHLVELLVFNTPQDRQKWISEINTWLGKIDDIYLKPSNKKPNWQTIYNWMVFDSSPHYDPGYIVSKVKKMASTRYPAVPVQDYDPALVIDQILKIIERCAKDIAADEFVDVGNYL